MLYPLWMVQVREGILGQKVNFSQKNVIVVVPKNVIETTILFCYFACWPCLQQLLVVLFVCACYLDGRFLIAFFDFHGNNFQSFSTKKIVLIWIYQFDKSRFWNCRNLQLGLHYNQIQHYLTPYKCVWLFFLWIKFTPSLLA